MAKSYCLNDFSRSLGNVLFMRYSDDAQELTMHTHSNYIEIVIVLSGIAIHKVNEETYFTKKGDVFVIGSNTTHGFEQANAFCICSIMYDSNKLDRLHLDIKSSLGHQVRFMTKSNTKETDWFKSNLSLSLSETEHIKGVLDNMLTEQTEKLQGWKEMMDSYLRYLLVYLSRHCIPLKSEDKTEAIDIANSISYMEAHFKDNITVEEIACKSYMSTRHFSRIFHTIYHTSPGNYLILLRLQYACSLLKNSGLSISQIATDSGFNDANYFCRQFSKKLNVTPKEYRMSNHSSKHCLTFFK